MNEPANVDSGREPVLLTAIYGVALNRATCVHCAGGIEGRVDAVIYRAGNDIARWYHPACWDADPAGKA